MYTENTIQKKKEKYICSGSHLLYVSNMEISWVNHQIH